MLHTWINHRSIDLISIFVVPCVSTLIIDLRQINYYTGEILYAALNKNTQQETKMNTR